MKLRYITEGRGLYIPQFFNKEGEWITIRKKDVPEKSQLESIAYFLGRGNGWSGILWYFSPRKGEDEGEMSVFFDNELKCAAFLGAFKLFYSDRSKEIDL